jgi:hypothetical protein
LPNTAANRTGKSRPDDIPVGRRLARSAWSVTAGVLVLLMLGSLAVLMVSAAPLWMWAAPAPPETRAYADEPAADDSLGLGPER